MNMKKRSNHIKKASLTLLIAFAIISFWRGIWGIMDIYLFPKNLLLSFISSILIGIIIVYSTKHTLKSLI
ncbi:hypothetical protein KAT36_01515 [Candidatus Pacearchaeota archaeon]|nr:hypothetical protein [Candidatus Pacearchaeota archaeon]